MLLSAVRKRRAARRLTHTVPATDSLAHVNNDSKAEDETEGGEPALEHKTTAYGARLEVPVEDAAVPPNQTTIDKVSLPDDPSRPTARRLLKNRARPLSHPNSFRHGILLAVKADEEDCNDCSNP